MYMLKSTVDCCCNVDKHVHHMGLIISEFHAHPTAIVVHHFKNGPNCKRRPVTAEDIQDPTKYDSDWCQSFSPTSKYITTSLIMHVEAAYQVSYSPSSPHHYFKQLPSSEMQFTQTNKHSLPSPSTSPQP